MGYGQILVRPFSRPPLQVLLALSGVYHPQNQYCIAVSGEVDGVFRGIMESLQKCFPNIHILVNNDPFQLINIFRIDR